MSVTRIVPQLRTTDLASSLRFYTTKLGFAVEFQYEDFYAGVRAGESVFHLKQVDDVDPSIRYVDDEDHFHLYFGTDDVEAVAAQLAANGVTIVRGVHETPWRTKELVINDDQGHTLYFGQAL